MNDYQTIVENIRRVILYNDTSESESLHFLAESYALSCKEVNARLLRCSQLIRIGNPSEAVRLADIEPDLLEAYALLDFPERSQWNEFVKKHKLPEASVLFEELAREINDAYTTVNPLAPLLKKHRFLALAHAPLTERIAVLREIVLMEPENLGWKTDLDSYEKVRFREIEKEIPQAIASKNVPKMSELVHEIDSNPWTFQPPEKLLQTLRKALKTESQRSTMSDLKHLTEKLNKAVASEDAATALKFADRWYGFVQQLGGSVPMELNMEVQNSLMWVEEQRRYLERERTFQEQQQIFRNEILSGIPVEKMHEKYVQLETLAEELDEGIPETLYQLYLSKAEASSVRKTRQFRVFLIVLIFLGLTVSGGMILTVRQFQNEQEAKKIASILQGYLDKEDFETASQYIEEQKSKTPQLFDNPSVMDIYSELQTAIDRETERKILFRESLQKARDSLKEGKLDDYALSQAKSREKTDRDKFELQTVEKENRNFLAEEQRQKDRTLQRELDAISADIRRLAPQKGKETDKMQSELNTLLQKAVDTRKIEGAGSKLLNERDSIIEDLTLWTNEIKQRNDFQKDFPQLTQTVADPQTYVKTLQTLEKKYPALSVSQDLKKLIQEQAIWSIITQWNEIVEKAPSNETGSAKATNQGSQAILKRSQTIREFLTLWNKNPGQFKQFPDYEALSQNIPYYRAEEERASRGQSLLDDLGKSMRRLEKPPLWLYYSEKDNLRYYLPNKPTRKNERYLVNDQGEKKSVNIPNTVQLESIQEAPHIQFAKLTLQGINQIEQSEGTSWTKTACVLLQKLQDDPKMDPILKYMLLQEMVNCFSKGDLSVRNGYDKHIAILDAEKLDESVNWLDPKSEGAIYQRKLATDWLEQLPLSQSAVDAALEDGRVYKSRSISQLKRIGWAQRLPDGNWVCQTVLEAIPDNNLFIVRGEAAEEGSYLLHFEQIRVLDSKRKTITPSPALLFGRPILMKNKPE